MLVIQLLAAIGWCVDDHSPDATTSCSSGAHPARDRRLSGDVRHQHVVTWPCDNGRPAISAWSAIGRRCTHACFRPATGRCGVLRVYRIGVAVGVTALIPGSHAVRKAATGSPATARCSIGRRSGIGTRVTTTAHATADSDHVATRLRDGRRGSSSANSRSARADGVGASARASRWVVRLLRGLSSSLAVARAVSGCRCHARVAVQLHADAEARSCHQRPMFQLALPRPGRRRRAGRNDLPRGYARVRGAIPGRCSSRGRARPTQGGRPCERINSTAAGPAGTPRPSRRAPRRWHAASACGVRGDVTGRRCRRARVIRAAQPISRMRSESPRACRGEHRCSRPDAQARDPQAFMLWRRLRPLAALRASAPELVEGARAGAWSAVTTGSETEMIISASQSQRRGRPRTGRGAQRPSRPLRPGRRARSPTASMLVDHSSTSFSRSCSSFLIRRSSFGEIFSSAIRRLTSNSREPW